MKLDKNELQESLTAFKPTKSFTFYNPRFILTGLDKDNPNNGQTYSKLREILKDNFSGFGSLKFSEKYPNQFTVTISTTQDDSGIIRSINSIVSEFDFEPYKE